MIQLKDVIQYYIGQRCFNTWFPEGHEQYDYSWALTGVCVNNAKPYELQNDEYTTCTNSIKPILRKLEDMTETEATELTKLQTDPKRHADIQILFIEKNRFHYIDGSKCSGDGWEENNDLWFYFDQCGPLECHHLLKQGFDLFSLIDNGFAIDQKTLNQKA